jgi:hypothetical protein
MFGRAARCGRQNSPGEFRVPNGTRKTDRVLGGVGVPLKRY